MLSSSVAHLYAALRRMRPCSAASALPAIEMRRETGAKIGFGRLMQVVSRLRRKSATCFRPTDLLLSPRLGLWSRCSAALLRPSDHVVGERTAFAATSVPREQLLGFSKRVCSCKPRLQHQGLAGVLHQSRRSAPSEHARRRETLPHKCSRRPPPPGRYSSSAFVIAPTASSTTRTETNR